MKKVAVTHTTIRNGSLFCRNCGGTFELKYPMPVDQVGKRIDSFNLLHADCQPGWKEPEADQSKEAKEKAMWWIANGHVGASSKTMWNCLMGNKDFEINHPYDPDDFSRCYKLLQAVPEWRTELSKLKPLSKAWNNLADNWDKLTAMYEENKRNEWKDYKKVGMYEFMQTLIKP